MAQSLNNMGALYSAMGRYDRAEALFQRCIAICEKRLGKDHPDLAMPLNNLAMVYHYTAQYARAQIPYRRSLQLLEAKRGKDHPDVAIALNNLAMLYQVMGQYARAEALLQRSLAIWEKQLGKDHPNVAMAVNNLATLYKEMGQYLRAEPLFQRSIQIGEAKFGKDHPSVAIALNNLAIVYWAMDQYARAEPLLRRSLEIWEKQLGKDHPNVGLAVSNLAMLYQEMGQYDRAEQLFQRSIQISEARLGKDHPSVAIALNNLATLYWAMNQAARAEPLLQRALKIWETALGEDHPNVAQGLDNLAGVYETLGRTPEAAARIERSRRILAGHVARVLPILSEPEQLAFLQTQEVSLHMALSLAVRHPNDAGLAAASAGWLLNGKALAQQALAQAALLTRDSKDPALRELTRQLLDIRGQLARLTLAGPQPGRHAERLQQLRQLAAREEELAGQIRRAGGAIGGDPWVELRRVRQELPADAVFLDIARIRLADFHAASADKRWTSPHYVAWLTQAEGTVRLIDLGPADRIDAAVRAVRKALQAAPDDIPLVGEAESEQELRKLLDGLSRQVLHPLLKEMGPRRRWLISPDGNLWLIPWEALTLPDGTYAIESHVIRYVVSGRDLVSGAAPAHLQPGPPLVLADPDFDLGRTEAAAETRRLLPEVQGDEESRPASRSFVRGRVRRLPGTAAEARAIAPRLKTYAGNEPHVYLDRQALEGVVKASRSPRVLVLSTHGFFLPEQEVNRGERTSSRVLADPLSRAAGGRENPLLRCGLLLAGCNSPVGDEGGDDGILTGLEVVGTDLRGTELVVLSACQTGLGEVRNGEGVAGLRQAFQLAGAEAVVATLWPVADRESAQLMGTFFANLARGPDKAAALRDAQLALIAGRRKEHSAAHPFFWAAFTLTGSAK